MPTLQPKSSRKRKAEDELSTNKHTIKARKRRDKLKGDTIREQVEKAKAADQGAITYAKKVLKKSVAFLSATIERQEEMIRRSALEVTTKRVRQNKDWQSVAKSLGSGEIGGEFAIEDDKNPAWKDIEYESDDDYEFEQMWRFDEKMNQEGIVSDQQAQTLKATGLTTHRQSIHHKKEMEFKFWQKKWKRSQKFFRKINKLSFGGMKYLERSSSPFFKNGRFYPIAPPKVYFTQGEKAIWKNLAAWAYNDNDWVDLPGPASRWTDISDEGFSFSDATSGHMEAFNMVYAQGVPANGSYERIFPSSNDLFVMEDNSQTQMALKAFHSL